MSEFTGWGRTNDIDFGDFVNFPYGSEMHIWKVVGAFKSNKYMKPPYTSCSEEKIHAGGVVPVLNIIHCGIDETKVIRVKASDCSKAEYPNPLREALRRIMEVEEPIMEGWETSAYKIAQEALGGEAHE